MTAFTPEALLNVLQGLPRADRYCVAFSGGADSHALLHAMTVIRPQLSVPLRAVHVDHGLQPSSAAWAEHCRRVCNDLKIPLRVHRVDLEPQAGGSIEAVAREARYAVLRRELAAGEAVLTAHHRDDQAETVLLRLMRGASSQGLRGMVPMRPFGRGWLCRPLLDVSRRALVDYAAANGLSWVDDPTNADHGPDRNFLRHKVVPLLESRWPAAAERLVLAASHARETAELLTDLAQADLEAVRYGDSVAVSRLRQLSDARRRNLIRHWIRTAGMEVPSRRRLEVGLRALAEAGADRQPEMVWRDGSVRRYRDQLHLLPPALPDPPPGSLPFVPPAALDIPGLGMLSTRAGCGGLASRWVGQPLTVRFRRGGERCRPAGRSGSHSLKQLFQEAGVPPWERDRVPLIWHGEDVVAVPGLCVAEGYRAEDGAGGLELCWEPTWRPVARCAK